MSMFGDDEPGGIDLIAENDGENMSFQPVGPDVWDAPEEQPTQRNPITHFGGELYSGFGPAPIIGAELYSGAHPALIGDEHDELPSPDLAPAVPAAHSAWDLQSVEKSFGEAVRGALAKELVMDAAMLMFAGESDDMGCGDWLPSRGIRG